VANGDLSPPEPVQMWLAGWVWWPWPGRDSTT